MTYRFRSSRVSRLFVALLDVRDPRTQTKLNKLEHLLFTVGERGPAQFHQQEGGYARKPGNVLHLEGQALDKLGILGTNPRFFMVMPKGRPMTLCQLLDLQTFPELAVKSDPARLVFEFARRVGHLGEDATEPVFEDARAVRSMATPFGSVVWAICSRQSRGSPSLKPLMCRIRPHVNTRLLPSSRYLKQQLAVYPPRRHAMRITVGNSDQ